MFVRTTLQQIRKIKNLNFGLNLKCNVAAGVSIRRTVSVATQLMFGFVGLAKCQESTEEDNRLRKNLVERRIKREMTLAAKSEHYLNALKVRWTQLHAVPGVFAYQLDVKRNRFLVGKHNFYAELNTDRMMNRRAPQVIESLNPKFKDKQFNFNKVDLLEVLLTIEHDNYETQIIVNKSPITSFHSLICTEPKRNLPQRITPQSLNFCITFMRNMNDEDMRMGYNSPGALASVNHLHYHLVYMPQDLYIDKVQLEELAGGYAYRLSTDMPTEAVCITFHANDQDEMVREKVEKLHTLTEWLCKKNLPHNLFITQDRRAGKRGDVLVFVFARSAYCVAKDLAAFNVGFCELAGYIPMGDATKLRDLTEDLVIERVRDVTGKGFEEVYDQVKQIVNAPRPSPIWELPFVL